MALYENDYLKDQDAFIIKRTFSAKQLVEHTKTHKSHLIPCHSEFKTIMKSMPVNIDSPYFFVNRHGKLEGKHYRLARRENVKRYASVHLEEKRRLMEGMQGREY